MQTRPTETAKKTLPHDVSETGHRYLIVARGGVESPASAILVAANQWRKVGEEFRSYLGREPDPR